MTTISFAIQKGGVGKTTTLIGLAEGLSEMGKRVLVVDLDEQCNASQWLLQAGPPSYMEAAQPTLGQAVRNELQSGRELDLGDVITETPFGVDLVPAGPYQNRTLWDLQDPFYLRQKLSGVEGGSQRPQNSRYDFTLVDTPPSSGRPVWIGLSASDGVIVPVHLSGLSLDGLNGFLQTLKQLEEEVGRRPAVTGIFANRVDVRRKAADQGRELLENRYPDALFDAQLRDRASVEGAGTARRPIFKRDDDGHPTEVFRDLAEEVIQRTK